GFPFKLANGLLYHMRKGGHNRLCIPSPCISPLLEMVHDQKHHFGVKRMMRGLVSFSFNSMTKV
ncbi:hypothetical protein B0T26DRAFT_601464, partial [Lasiosphaeria miniovina]